MALEQQHALAIQTHIQEHGLTGLRELIMTLLQQSQNVEIKIGITGPAGAGKSSFINAIRDLADDDEGAAETGPTQTTLEATGYPHPTNNKITFWDLPGFGTRSYPDVAKYFEMFELRKYDVFLVLTANRFTQNDFLLAEKIREKGKFFFFIRTHVDVDIAFEQGKRSFNERAVLKRIRDDCLENLNDLEDRAYHQEVVYLISNHHPKKWDFPGLTEAIITSLPDHQKESLAITLKNRTRAMLEMKVKYLEGRIWKVATASAAGAVAPVPGLSFLTDMAMIYEELSFYKSQFDFPEVGSIEFQAMTRENQETVQRFCFSNKKDIISSLALYAARSVAEEIVRYIPYVGSYIAKSISFGATYAFLDEVLVT